MLKVGFADGEWHKAVVFKGAGAAGGGETSLVVDRVLRASSEMHSRASRKRRRKQRQEQVSGYARLRPFFGNVYNTWIFLQIDSFFTLLTSTLFTMMPKNCQKQKILLWLQCKSVALITCSQ